MRTTSIAPSMFVLAAMLSSCAREVPLRIGPIALVADLAQLEVRVWNGPTCPTDARAAASPSTLDRVVVSRSYGGVASASAVGAVPAGAHAVSVVARRDDCTVVLYGCTPSVDFAAVSAVSVTWSSVVSGPSCEAGLACDEGRCEGSPLVDGGVARDGG